MGISTFGGSSSAGGTGSEGVVSDGMVVGQVVQAGGGLNMLPAMGAILKKDDFPLAYQALQNINTIEINSLPANLSSTSLDFANLVIPSASIPAINTVVALAASGSINVSQDNGQTWRNITLPADPITGIVPNWKALASSDSGFCALSDKYSYVSPDGVNWIRGNALPQLIFAGSLSWTGTKFAFFGSLTPTGAVATGNMYITSVDGVSWDNSNAIPLPYVTRIFTLNNGSFFAYCAQDTRNVAIGRVALSSDGVYWTSQNLPGAELFSGAAYNPATNTILLLCSTKLYSSTDGGITWTVTLLSSTVVGGPISVTSTLASTDSSFVLCLANGTTSGTSMYRSADGINWTLIASFGVMSTQASQNVATDGTTIVIPQNGFVAVSKDDGATWAAVIPAVLPGAQWNSVIYTGAQFIVFSNANSNSYKSTDGLNWTLASNTVPTNAVGPWNLYNYNAALNTHFLTSNGQPGNPTAIAVCLTSTDGGITWVSRALPASVVCYGIASSGSKTIITNNTGANVALTTNGTAFAAQTSTGSGGWLVAASPAQFVRIPIITGALSAAMTIYTSPDAVTWTARTVPLPTGLTSWCPCGVFWNGSTFVIIGAQNSIVSTPNTTCLATSADAITWAFTMTPFNGQQFQWSLNYFFTPLAYGNNGGMLFLPKFSSSTLIISCKDNLLTWGAANRWVPQGAASASGFNFTGKTNCGGGSEIACLSGSFALRYSDATGQLDIQCVNGLGFMGGRTSITLKNRNGWYSFPTTNLNPLMTPAAQYPLLKSVDFKNWTLACNFETNLGYESVTQFNGKFYGFNSISFYSFNDDVSGWSRKPVLFASGSMSTRLFAGNTTTKCWHIITLLPNASLYNTYTYTGEFDGNNVLMKAPAYSGTNMTVNMVSYKWARKGNVVVTGYNEATVSVSSDNGNTWQPMYIGSTITVGNFAYSPEADVFVMIPYSAAAGASIAAPVAHSLAYSSKDGAHWVAHQLPSSQKWVSVESFGNLMFALSTGSSSVWAFSADGVNWVQVAAPTASDWGFACRTNQSLVASVGTTTGNATMGMVGRFYDPETEFQLPVFSASFGQPGWFVKVK